MIIFSFFHFENYWLFGLQIASANLGRPLITYPTLINTVEPLLTDTSNMDTSLTQTVHLVLGKCPYTLCKNNLHNMDPL